MAGNILDEIVANKKLEVAAAKEQCNYDGLEEKPLFNRPTISIRDSLIRPDRTGIIAEFKRRSPSKGLINGTSKVEDVARGYFEAGASGNSILTDENYFQGTLEDIETARPHTDLPILRKDFVVDEYQIVEAKACGADFILLIAASLTPKEIKRFAKLAKSSDLGVLMEVHNEEELVRSLDQNLDLIGVNNRDLKRFHVDVQTSYDLVDKIPDEFLKISESGISTPQMIKDLKDAGFHGFLIGECFMKEEDPVKAIHEFVETYKSL